MSSTSQDEPPVTITKQKFILVIISNSKVKISFLFRPVTRNILNYQPFENVYRLLYTRTIGLKIGLKISQH